LKLANIIPFFRPGFKWAFHVFYVARFVNVRQLIFENGRSKMTRL
jgi:hypothetical protein